MEFDRSRGVGGRIPKQRFRCFFSRSEDKKERNVKLLPLLYLSYLELQLREEEPGVAGDDD